MRRSSSAAILVVAMIAGAPRHPQIAAQTQEKLDLAGRWTLNREMSQFPREVGFDLDWVSADGSIPRAAARGGGRSGGRGGGGGRSQSGGSAAAVAGVLARRESVEDVQRTQQLTAEVRTPSSHLTIAETPATVTITDNDRGQSRTFHLDGREEALQLDGAVVAVIAKREAGRLVVLYKVEPGRELRYTYGHSATPSRLVVDVQFVERGGAGDEVRRVYEPASPTETFAPIPAAPTTPSKSYPTAPGAAPGNAPVPTAADRAQPQPYNQQPDAELKGLNKLGLVVEGLSSQAAACGLSQGALETATSKRLSDAGFKVLRNSDEDTYVYVNVITTSLSTGLCVSRYDAFLYTHTTATLSYQEKPVLVQVSLLHRGGIAGGSPAAHADGVLKGVQEYLDQFSTRIHDANK